MRFSLIKQAFYLDKSEYGDALPRDVVSITDADYVKFYAGIKGGCVVYDDGEGLVLSSARPDSYHSWNGAMRQWTLTDEAAAQKSTDEAARLIKSAAKEIERATTQIAILGDKIELDDYDEGETTASVKASLTIWKKYRIACNSVVSGSASELPIAPDMVGA